MENTTLVIFCRRPVPGIGKQRIAAELGQQAAVEIGELLLTATLEDTHDWAGKVILAPARAMDTAWAEALLKNAHVIPQPQGNLGRRIAVVHAQAQQAGNDRIIIVGTDAPALTFDCLNQAANSLTTHDTVIIPARDGGVTLLGTRLQWPALDNLPWETSRLGEALIGQCIAAGHRVCVLETSSDVDTRQDLVDIYERLETDQRPGRIALCNWIVRAGLIPTTPGLHSKISVVVPVYNDLVALQQLLKHLVSLRPAIDEIIVADGSSHNDCEQLCADYGTVYLRTDANRGKQLRAGASASSGNILWFLHADSVPTQNAAQFIREHLQTTNTSGYFRFRFDGPERWHKRFLERAINFRAQFGIPYGDQGLFVLRQAYFAAGGHAETPLFEEVPLIKNLRASAGCSAVSATINVSPRRWERDGWLRRSVHNRVLAFAFAMGVAPEKLARNYDSITHSKNTAEDLDG